MTPSCRLASLVAAIFWVISAMQPLTLTLDCLQAELQAAAWYNRNAAWAASFAAVCVSTDDSSGC